MNSMLEIKQQEMRERWIQSKPAKRKVSPKKKREYNVAALIAAGKLPYSRWNASMYSAQRMLDAGWTALTYDTFTIPCDLCKRPMRDRQFNVDHDHMTNHIRGLLCHQCNIGLGNFRDDLGLLEEAKKYLITRQYGKPPLIP